MPRPGSEAFPMSSYIGGAAACIGGLLLLIGSTLLKGLGLVRKSLVSRLAQLYYLALILFNAFSLYAFATHHFGKFGCAVSPPNTTPNLRYLCAFVAPRASVAPRREHSAVRSRRTRRTYSDCATGRLGSTRSSSQCYNRTDHTSAPPYATCCAQFATATTCKRCRRRYKSCCYPVHRASPRTSCRGSQTCSGSYSRWCSSIGARSASLNHSSRGSVRTARTIRTQHDMRISAHCHNPTITYCCRGGNAVRITQDHHPGDRVADYLYM